MKLPQAWTTTASTKVEAKTAVNARINMSEEIAGAGLCPDCQKPMGLSVANNIQVKACHSCRIVVPLPDSEIKEEQLLLL